jgi:hypothetical protein
MLDGSRVANGPLGCLSRPVVETLLDFRDRFHLRGSKGTGFLRERYSSRVKSRSIVTQRITLILGVTVAFAWALVRVAPQLLPDPDDRLAEAIAWPNPDFGPVQAYTRSSPLSALVAKASQISSVQTWIWMHVVVIVLATALLSLWAYRNTTALDQKRRAARLAVLIPILGSVFVTIGNYDAFTLLALSLALFGWSSGKPLLAVAAGVVFGFQHFEQAVVACIALAIAAYALRERLSSGKRGAVSALWLLGGVLVGKLVLILTLVGLGVDPFEGRAVYMTKDVVSSAVKNSIDFGPTLLMSWFCGFWVIVVLAFFLVKSNRNRMLLALSLLLPAFMAVITLSQTRVFGLMTTLLLMVLIVTVLSSADYLANGRVLVVAEVMAWIIVPLHLDMSLEHGIVIYGSQAFSNSYVLFHLLIG